MRSKNETHLCVGALIAITIVATNVNAQSPALPSELRIRTISEEATRDEPVDIGVVIDERIFALDSAPPAGPDNGTSEPESPDPDDAEFNGRLLGKSAAKKPKKDGTYKFPPAYIMLPTGDSVARVVRRAVREGFRRAGYRVTTSNRDGQDPIPIKVIVKEFWQWSSPDPFEKNAFSMRSNIVIQIEGDVPAFRVGKTINRQRSVLSRRIDDGGRWGNVGTRNLESVIDDVFTLLNTLTDENIGAHHAASDWSVADELRELEALREAGTISDAEFEELKRNVISSAYQ